MCNTEIPTYFYLHFLSIMSMIRKTIHVSNKNTRFLDMTLRSTRNLFSILLKIKHVCAVCVPDILRQY